MYHTLKKKSTGLVAFFEKKGEIPFLFAEMCRWSICKSMTKKVLYPEIEPEGVTEGI